MNFLDTRAQERATARDEAKQTDSESCTEAKLLKGYTEVFYRTRSPVSTLMTSLKAFSVERDNKEMLIEVLKPGLYLVSYPQTGASDKIDLTALADAILNTFGE